MTKWKPDLSNRNGPKYGAIAEALAEDIRNGTLVPGMRLPAQRDLSYDLGVNVNTVTRAYAVAEKRGLIVSEVGRGTFVRFSPAPEAVPWPKGGVDNEALDFGTNFPAITVTDSALKAALAQLGKQGNVSELMRYQPESFLPAHVAAGRSWLARMGYSVTDERVLITNGALHSGFVSLLALTRPGDLVLVEELTSPAIKGIASMLKIRLKGVAVDAEGLVPSALEKALEQEQARALYIVPNMQNPTLGTLSLERRMQIAEIATARGLFIVEDDVYGCLVQNPPPPIASFAPSLTCYTSSLSKIGVPGLRVGYLAAPLSLRSQILAGLRVSTWMPAPILAQLATNLIADGTIIGLIEEQRAEAARRLAIATEVLDGMEFASSQYGLHIWLNLPDPWRPGEFVASLSQRGIVVTSAENFFVGRGSVPPAVRVCLGAVRDRERLREGLSIIAETSGRSAIPFANVVY